MASIEKRERSDGDHRVRIYPGGLKGTHCVDCRRDLRLKASPGPCTWALCDAQTPPLWHQGGEPCGCTREAGHGAAQPEGHADRDHVCSCGSRWDSTEEEI